MIAENINIEKLNKRQLLVIFNSFLLQSCFAIEESCYDGDPLEVKINDGARKFDLYFLLKNISLQMMQQTRA